MMWSIIYQLVLSLGWCLIFLGVAESRSRYPYKRVTFKNGTVANCEAVTCTPGFERNEECTHEFGPMKCEKCTPGLYQCQYITESNIPCQKAVCPELGTETRLSLTHNKDGTCDIQCVCNEEKGFSGSNYLDCKLQETPCGVNSELRNGSCVGCREGFHNPDEKFGRCIPKTSEKNVTTPSQQEVVTTSPNYSSLEILPVNTTRPILAETEQEGGFKHVEPTVPPTEQPKSKESSGVNNTGWWIFGAVLIALLIIVLVLCCRGTISCNNSAFCFGKITNILTGTQHQARNVGTSTAVDAEEHSGDPPSYSSSAAVPNAIPGALLVGIPGCGPEEEPQCLPGRPHSSVDGAGEIGNHVPKESWNSIAGSPTDGYQETQHGNTNVSFPTLNTAGESSLTGPRPQGRETESSIHSTDPDNTEIAEVDIRPGDGVLEPLLQTQGFRETADESPSGVGITTSEIPTLLRKSFSGDSLFNNN